MLPVKLRLAMFFVLVGCAPPNGGVEAPEPYVPPPGVDAAPPPDAAPPRPDAGPPEADAAPELVPGVGLRYKPKNPTACGDKNDTPILPEDDGSGGGSSDEWSKMPRLELEEHGGLDKTTVLRDDDPAAMGAPPIIITTPLALGDDPDHDCLSSAEEAKLGTDPSNPDSDGDGWFDGPCNERRKLVLTRIYARDEQEDFGDDEFYLVADDVRHPQDDLDAYWDFDDGDSMDTHWLLATRTRGVGDKPLALVQVEGWEDDFEVFNTWSADDLLFTTGIDLGAFSDGATFTRRFQDAKDDDYDYELTFKVEIEKFADPNPRDPAGDGDHDGITEANEARVARDFGGIVDPQRPDVLVEVDWMKGHALRTQAKREVVTQLYRNGISLHVLRDEELPVDGCLSVPEARKLYSDHFGRKGYNAFRYAVVGEQIWNDASGVSWGDIFLVDDSTWWINGWTLPQAGTFIHELGHSLSLNKEMFHLIDTIAWFSYDSSMNYLYQATKVDYSYDGGGGDSWDHDDWAKVDPAYALRYSFALTTSTETGICQ